MDSADINSKLSVQNLTSISQTNAEKPAPTNSNLNEEWLEIGKIIAPQGLNGQVRVYPTSDFPERFLQPGQRWILRSTDMKPQPIELLEGRYLEGKGLYVLELAQVDDRSQAEALRGCKLLVPASDRPILGEDEYHVLDLIGLEVFNQLTQELLGKVIDVIAAGNDLLEVQLQQVSAIASNQQDKETREEPVFQETKPNKGKRKSKSSKSNTVLIPFVKAIVPVVDIENRRVEITPPPGLLEINLDPSKVI